MALNSYLDEFGNFGFRFNRPNVSTHFLVGGIVFDDVNLAALDALSEQIANRHFQGSEIKSSKIADDDTRRLNILNELLAGDFYIYAMVFDKRRMTGKGLRQKRSFIKFLNRKAYENLAISYDSIRIVADEHGGKEFMDSFRAYVDTNFFSFLRCFGS